MTAWHWPQWTVVLLLALSVGANIGWHNQSRGSFNGVRGILTAGITAWLLWCGGFWG